MLRIRAFMVGMLLLAAACTNPPQPPPSTRATTTPLSVTLDGGYAFVQQVDGSLTVDSLNNHHPMVLWLDNGSVEGQQPPANHKWTWKLDQKRLSIAASSGGSPEVQLPPVREVPQPADQTKCTADPNRNTPQANNGFYWPELNAWEAASTFKEDVKTLGAQVAFHGGSVSILRAGGCFEIRDPKGKTVVHRPMVMGTQSIQFSSVLPEARLTLTLDGLQGGQTSQAITILPDAATGRIDLLIKHEDWNDQMASVPPGKLPKQIPDFEMFQVLLGLKATEYHTLWLDREPPQVHPGDECVPGFFSLRPSMPPFVDPPRPEEIKR